ncbi:MAG: DUF1800 domain-containing protein [Saprospiraceae bacterium]
MPINSPLLPYSGPFNKPELLHLLRRTLLGVSNADLNHFKGKSLNQVVDELLTFGTTVAPPVKNYSARVNNLPDPTALDTEVQLGQTWVDTPIRNQTTNPDGSRRESLKAWWMGLMLGQERNLREQMVLFWHNHFSTEANDVGNAQMSYRTNKLFRENAVGNFRDFLFKITLDPGMLKYLNGYLNKATAPDENYARELQELFCVGKGPGSGYTEDDVKAAARVLTGWSLITQEGTPAVPVTPYVKENLNNHDKKDKVFSAFYGNKVIKAVATPTRATMEAEIRELIDMILAVEETSKFICRKLYTYFCYYEITPDVEVNLIEPLAEVFRNSNYDLKVLLKAFFTADYFFKPELRGAMIKSGMQFVIGKTRAFGYQIPDASKFEAQYYYWSVFKNYARNMGQDIMDPPNVAGWPAYYQVPQFHEMWVDTATYPERKNFYENISKNGLNSGTFYYQDVSKNVKVTVDFVAFAKQFSVPENPNILVAEACDLLFGVPVSQAVKDQLKTSFLLENQSSDYYWTEAWLEYINNPSTTDPEAKRVPTMLKNLFLDMESAAEFHLC